MRLRSLLTGVLAAVTVTGALAGSSAADGAATSSPPAWRLVYQTHLRADVYMAGVVAVDQEHAWAIGWENSRGFVLRWNGRDWALMKRLPASDLPVAVTATSPSDLWVVVQAGSGADVAYRWDGHQWSEIAMPTRGDVVAAASSPTDAWFFDGSALHRWNGVTWSRQLTRAPVALATGPGGQVWEASHTHGLRLIVRRWNGTKWVTAQTPHPVVFADGAGKPGFIELSVSSARNIAIVYRTPVLANGHAGNRALLRTGGRWHVTSLPSGSVGDVAATGSRMAWDGNGIFYTGRHWIRGSIIGGTYLAGIPGTDATWAVGAPTGPSQRVQGLIWLSGKL